MKSITFDAHDVLSTLAGRKSLIVAPIEPHPSEDDTVLGPCVYTPAVTINGGCEPGDDVFGIYDAEGQWGIKCPYGQPGDELWVRETYTVEPIDMMARDHNIRYKADGAEREIRGWSSCGDGVAIDGASEAVEYPCESYGVWQPSSRMYKWASRLTLKITDVRVKRVQDVTEEEARACGCPDVLNDTWPTIAEYHPIEALSEQWNTRHAKRGCPWEDNPWAWLIGFEIKENRR